jgi:fructokinase
VAYLGRLSTDRFGRNLERMLREDGVQLDATARTDEPTTLALAEVDPGGGARYRFYATETAATGLTPAGALAALPDDPPDILHVGTLGLTLEPVAGALEAVVERLAGSALVAVDPNVRPGAIDDPPAYRARLARVLGRTHLVKVSEEDLAWLDPSRPPIDAARGLIELGPTVVLLTRGAGGATVVSPSCEIAVPAPAVEVVDTIGAGDAFGGGFLAWWHARDLGRDALADADLVAEGTRFAARVAALTCARPGASPPRLRDLDDAAGRGGL